MTLTKREFLLAGAATGALLAKPASADTGTVAALNSMTKDARPITAVEHQSRIAKAVALMQQNELSALVIEAGSALTYFTGIRWWRSERFTGAVLRADGQFCIVTPFFEEPSIREQMLFGDDVRTWHEDESPFSLVHEFISEKYPGGDIGFEETTRFFIVDGIASFSDKFGMVNGQAVTRGCRMIKSPAELALMQIANNVTMAAYEYIYPRVRVGMTATDISNMMNAATKAFGAEPVFSMTLLGPASAYPHGTRQPQTVRSGEVILMDCGCHVHGYQSDISRTWVFGKASKDQTRVWDTVKRGQQIALEYIKPGVAAGEVDRVVRDFYENEGFGPGYQTPGLTHRLGHGIGMDGHEPINFVGNETTPLAEGMCFSNEPGIYLPGQFGVRLEDCLSVGPDGPVLFSSLSPSIERPFG